MKIHTEKDCQKIVALEIDETLENPLPVDGQTWSLGREQKREEKREKSAAGTTQYGRVCAMAVRAKSVIYHRGFLDVDDGSLKAAGRSAVRT